MRSGADYPGNIVRKLRLVELFSAELPQHLSRATAKPRVFGGRYDPRLSCQDHITELAALKLRQADTVSVMAAPRSLSDEKLAPANGSLGRAQPFFTFLQKKPFNRGPDKSRPCRVFRAQDS